MKQLFYILIFLALPCIGFSTNDISKLDATLRDFGSLYVPNYSGSVSIDDYMIQLNEMQQFAPAQYDSISVLKTYTKQADKTKQVFEYTKQSTAHFSELVSYDTLTRKMGAHTYLMASIIFTVSHPMPEMQQKRRLYAKFVIVNNKLRLWGKIQVMTDRQYFETELYEVYDDRKTHFNTQYLETGIAYVDTTYGLVPFTKKNKWGLLKLNGNIAVEAQFDSLYSFRNGVALVKKGSVYNLLQPDGTFVLPTWSSYIYCSKQNDEYEYWQAVSKNKYKQIQLPPMPLLAKNNAAFTEQFYGNKHIVSKPTEIACTPHNFELYNNSTQTRIATFQDYELFERLGDYFFAIQQDTSRGIDTNGTILFNTTHICKPEFPGYILVYNRSARLFGVYCPYTNQYIQPTYTFLLPVERDRFFIGITTKNELEYVLKK